MSTIIIASLSITTLASTAVALSMWSPNMISNSVVHGFLFATFTPLALRIIKIPFGINRASNYTRLSRVHILTAISGVLILIFRIGYNLANSFFYPELKQSGYMESTEQLWYQGFNLTSILSLYRHLFQLTMESQLFWRFFIPIFILQTIYDWILFVYEDFFILFKDLGLGGSGTTFYGWALARFRAFAANADVLHPPRVPQTANPWRGRLNILPQRQGPRPTILGVTPQRQVDFPAPPNTAAALDRLFEQFVNTPETAGRDHITMTRSYLEPGLLALRRTLTIPTNEQGGPLNPSTVALNSRDAFGGEIIHSHREGTTHVILHPEDVRRVIEGGWGERHPFCTGIWYWKPWFNWLRGVSTPVPEYIVILYAPRHQGDFDVIREISRAAVWHATEGRLYGITADTYPFPPAPGAAT